MKLTYAELKQKPRILLSLTGLRVSEFEKLLVSFEKAWDSESKKKAEQPERKRGVGGGRKATLATMADKQLFILFYFRHYPTQEVQGYLFEMGQPQANEWVHRLSHLLNQALGYEKQLPEREPGNLKDVLSRCPSLEFMIDGTERPINRPKDKEDRKTYYSGKRKAHTVKNIVISERKKKIVFLSDTHEGKKHDKKIVDEEGYEFPEGSTVWQDTGFQGHAPPDIIIKQPKKKPKNKELTQAEKDQNRAISQVRVEIEHQIGGVKRGRILVDKFRNWKAHYLDDVMETACGLHNFRLTERGHVA